MKRDNSQLEILNPEEMDFDFAENIMKPMSWSRLDSYLTCPKKYQLSYQEMVPRGFSMPLATGSSIHDPMEVAVNKMVSGEKVTLKDIDVMYANALDKNDPAGLLTNDEIEDGRTWLHMTFKRMEKILDGSLNNIIGVEYGFKYIIGIGIFEGWIDLIVKDKDEHGEFIHIIDYKSGKAFDKDNKRKSTSRTKYSGQMKLYTLAMKRKFGMRVKASLYYLRHDLIDTYEFSDDELEDFEIMAHNAQIRMLKDQKYPPTQGQRNGVLCAFCSYATPELCPRGAKAADLHKRFQDKRMFVKVQKKNKPEPEAVVA